MSTTRSLAPPAPATDDGAAAGTALLLVGHGATRPEAGLLLRRLARMLARRMAGAPVVAAAIYGGPDLSAALRSLAGRDVVAMPLVMCNGDLVVAGVTTATAALPAPARPRSIRFAAPVGLDAGLVDVIERAAVKACKGRGWLPATTRLVLVAHGSPGRPASRRMAEAHAGELVGRGVFGAVHTAFLEEPPALPEVIGDAEGPVAVVGLFLGGGRHAKDDVVDTVGGRRDVAYVGAIGTLPEFAARLAVVAKEVSSPPQAALTA